LLRILTIKKSQRQPPIFGALPPCLSSLLKGAFFLETHFEPCGKPKIPARRSRNQKSFETQSPQSRKGPEGFMRNARKQERTSSLNLFSCLPVFLIQSLLRFGRLKIYAERNEIKG
jgi:hypothetical protein